MTNDSSIDRDQIEALAEEFLSRRRRGETPSLQEYIDRYPLLAGEIRDVFPALVVLEDVDPQSQDLGRSPPGAASTEGPLRISQLGDFRILREVGRGGMGIVYEAEQLSLGRRVALKVLPQQMLANAKYVHRFEREARAAARLHHTNIVPVFGVGEHEGVHYFVMQFIQGLGLDQVIDEVRRLRKADAGGSSAVPVGELKVERRHDLSASDVARSLITGRFSGRTNGVPDPDRTVLRAREARDTTDSLEGDDRSASEMERLSDTFSIASSSTLLPGRGRSSEANRDRREGTYWHSVAHIGRQVALALDHAHEQGVLHRDVKPSNLLLDIRGTVWVTDFGLAKSAGKHDLTQFGDVLGTLRYIPPEAFHGLADARSDVYSLGLTLYELVSLKPAFQEQDRQRLLKLLSTDEPERVDAANPEVPRDLATIVHKAIDREPKHRYQTARELADDLQRFLDDEAIKARPITSVERLARWGRRNRPFAAALSVIGALLAVGTVALLVALAHFHSVAARMTELADQREQERRAALDARNEADVARRGESHLRQREAGLRRQSEAAEALARERAETVRRNLYLAEMGVAQQALAGMNGARRVRDLLARWRPLPAGDALAQVAPPAGDLANDAPDLRGWEWYYLESRSHRSLFSLSENWGPVLAAAYSPDARCFAIATTQLGAEVRDAESGRLLLAIRDSVAPVRSLSWSPDSTLLAIGGDGQTVQLWNVASGRRIAEMSGHAGAVTDVDFDSTGRRLLSAGRDGTIRIWDASEHRQMGLIRGHTAAVDCARWDPSGSRIASISTDSTIRIWDAATGDEQVRAQNPVWRARLCWSPDGRRLASTSSENLACKVWDAQSGEEIRQFRGHAGEVCSVTFDREGKRLVSTGIDGLVQIWDVETGLPLKGLRGHFSTVNCASWSPDGRRLLSAGDDGSVHVWNSEGDQDFIALRGHTGYLKCLAWSADGRMLASGGNDETLRLWDVAEGRQAASIPSPGGSVISVCWNPRWPQVAAGSDDGRIRIWDHPSGQLVSTLDGQSGFVAALDWNVDAIRLASGYADGTIRIWEPSDRDRQPQKLLGHQGEVTTVRFSPDGRWLASSSHDRTIRIWDVATAAEVATLAGHKHAVDGVCWAPDGTRLASSSWDGTLKIWDVASRSERATLRGHAAIVYTVAWSPDGTQLASASFDQSIHIFDATWAVERAGTAATLAALDRRLARGPERVRDRLLHAAALEGLGDRAEAERQRAELAGGQSHDDSRDGERNAREYADFLLLRAIADMEWSPVSIASMSSAGGATLAGQPDNSILVGGILPAADEYELSLAIPAGRVTGLQLEGLPHSSLPNRGSGRDVIGNFAITSLVVSPDASNVGNQSPEVPLSCMWTDFTQAKFRAGRVTDRSGSDWGWAVHPLMGQRHALVMDFGRPLDLEDGGRLSVRIGCRHSAFGGSVLGHFRLSLGRLPNAARLLRLRDQLAHSGARGWPRLAAIAALTGRQTAATTALDQSARLASDDLSAEELFLLALAALRLDRSASSEAYLNRGLKLIAEGPLDETTIELARDTLSACRHLGDAATDELLALTRTRESFLGK